MKKKLNDFILEQFDQALKAYEKCKNDPQTSSYIAGVIYGLSLVHKEINKN